MHKVILLKNFFELSHFWSSVTVHKVLFLQDLIVYITAKTFNFHFFISCKPGKTTAYQPRVRVGGNSVQFFPAVLQVFKSTWRTIFQLA